MKPETKSMVRCVEIWRAVMASMVFMPMHSCSGSDGADADVQALAGAAHPLYIRH